MDFKIDRLKPGDEQIALQVVRELKPKDERDGREPSSQHLKQFLSLRTNCLIVGSAGRKLVGFLTAYKMPSLTREANMAYLYEIEVGLKYRRLGIGKQMINLLKVLCAEDAVEEIWVASENDNLAAKRLYESTGGICEHPGQSEFVYKLKY